MKKICLISLILIFLFTSCTSPAEDNEQDGTAPQDTTQATTAAVTETTEVVTTEATTEPEVLTPVTNAPTTDAEIIALAQEIVEVLKNEDYEGLATYVSDTYKLGLSPYSYADFSSLIYLTTADIIAIPTTPTALTWGIQDGSGDPIILNPSDYFDNYVNDEDFLTAPNVSLDLVIGTGNMMDNTSTAPGVDHFVEFNFPGFDPQYGGMDWKSLRLAFHVEPSGTFYLIYIIHDGWTT